MKRSFIVFILIVCLIRCNISLRAQAPFSIRYEFIGCSDNQIDGTATAVVNSLINGYISKYASGVKMTRQACEALRSAIPNTFEVGYGCRVKIIIGGCTGFDVYSNGTSINGNNDIFGMSKGQSNFIVNPALANQYSVEDHTYALDVLIGNRGASPGITYATTADQNYNNALDHIFIKGKLPEEQWYIPDEYITGDKKFVPVNMRDDRGTPDLLFDKDVKIAPVKSVKTYYEEPKESIIDFGSEIAKDGLKIGAQIGEVIPATAKFAKFNVLTSILIDSNVNLYRELIKCATNGCLSSNEIFKNSWGVDFEKMWDNAKIASKYMTGLEGEYSQNIAAGALVPVVVVGELYNNITGQGSEVFVGDAEKAIVDYVTDVFADKATNFARKNASVFVKTRVAPVSGNSMEFHKGAKNAVDFSQISTDFVDMGFKIKNGYDESN